MAGEKNLNKLILTLNPMLNDGEYIFTTLPNLHIINREDTICEFKENEGTTVILEKSKADQLGLDYDYIASWITLNVHSSLDAVGLTATFATALAEHKISCNVIAGYYHDHIFVNKEDSLKAMKVLNTMRP